MELSEKAKLYKIDVRRGVSGASLTSFGSGGEVKYLLLPQTTSALKVGLQLLKESGIPYRLIGGGSNVLLPDEGYDGALLRLSRLCDLSTDGETLCASAGVKLPILSSFAAKNALGGLEFLRDIPGTVGGAVKTNAGAFGEMLSDRLVSVTILTEQGSVEELSPRELCPADHNACLPSGAIVLHATFRLQKGDFESIEDKMRQMRERRRRTQPRERSAGSVFRPCGGIPAAVYIEKTGLKGLAIGGAELSVVHCNFIVNIGGATTKDFFDVGEIVRQEVKRQSGVTLEYEVERICSPKRF